MNRVSKKRAKELPILRKLVRKKLQETRFCERCATKSLLVRATCVHHWAGRRWNLLVYDTFRSSCWKCNQFAKEHPKEARAENWIAPVGVYAT